MKKPQVEFKPINLQQWKASIIAMREDSFICSFGNSDRFWGEDGKGAEKYIQWLDQKIKSDPYSAIHLWSKGKIIGQIEIGAYKQQEQTGYVYLYYLIPEARGLGLGTLIDKYSIQYFLSKKFRQAYLSVSPQNERAISFYQNIGWKRVGQRPDKPEVDLMKKDF